RRNHSATASSSSVMPTLASTTKSTTSADLTADSTCRDTFASRSDPPGIHPPVSTTWNGTPSHSASSTLRSRVTPGRFSTIAACSPMMRLNSVDFPTFGRPTMATTGTAASAMMRTHERSGVDAESSAQRPAVGGDHLDGSREIGHRGAVEEPSVVGQAYIGQQVAVSRRLAAEHPGDILTDHQSRYG